MEPASDRFKTKTNVECHITCALDGQSTSPQRCFVQRQLKKYKKTHLQRGKVLLGHVA